MPIFHFISVTPMMVSPVAKPQVVVGHFFVAGDDQHKAWSVIGDFSELIEAAEVLVAMVPDSRNPLVTSTFMVRELQDTSDFRHWARTQDGYRVYCRGQEPMSQRRSQAA